MTTNDQQLSSGQQLHERHKSAADPATLALLDAGYAALRCADWDAARVAFTTALGEITSPEAHDGLGLALWWLNEISAAHHHRTQAFLGYQQNGNLRRAAWLAAWLAREQVFFRSNISAMNGWFARAERLLGEIGSCAEQGWFDLYRATMTAPPATLREIARSTTVLARAHSNPDLAGLAIANMGLGAVAIGDLIEGLTNIDEAMAMATGDEIRDHFVVCEIFCVTLSACELAGDWVRTDQWCTLARAYAEQHHSPFLSAYCRTTYGAVLMVTGRWQEAEQVLSEAIACFDAGHQGLRVHALLKLADLRVRQGRLEEAAVLLTGYEDYGGAALPCARLHLARGEAALARAVLQQTLQRMEERSLHRAPLLRLLVECCLAIGDHMNAQYAYDQLAIQATHTQSNILLAEADLALGLIRQAASDPQALDCFSQALTRLTNLEQSVLAGRIRLELARTVYANDPAGSITWARAALACFTRLGASQDADAARHFLRSVGITVAPAAGTALQSLLTTREGEVLALLAHGLTNRSIAARLVISEKTAEHHVRQILAKLGLQGRAEAAAYAVRQGLVANQD
jgi:ATP/maltotriose-dependent transcriptional regulator MalT